MTVILSFLVFINPSIAGTIPKQGYTCPDYTWTAYGDTCSTDKTTSYVWKQGHTCPDYTWTSYGEVCFIYETWRVLRKSGYTCPDYTWTAYGNYCIKKG